METIPPKARGFISGLLQEGYAAGYLLASLASFFLLDRIGWRGMFMVGVIPAILVVVIRLGVKESPVFETRRDTAPKRSLVFLTGLGLIALAVAMGPALAGALDKTAMLKWVYFVDAPIALCGLWVFRRHWKMALYAVVLMTGFNFFSHGAQDLYPTFLAKQHGLNTQAVTSLAIIGNIGAILGGLAFGAWSERWGRRWSIIIASCLSLTIIPIWAFSHSLGMLALGAFAMQVMVQGAWGVIPAHLNELSPAAARGAFPGFVYQLGNLLASGCGVWQAQIAEARGGSYGLALAVVVGGVALIIAAMTLFGPQRQGVDFAKAD